MRIEFVRRKRKWLWLLLIPLVGLSVPFLLIAMMMGTRLLSSVAGPVNIWSTPSHVASIKDVAGLYELADIRWSGEQPIEAVVSRRSGFRLSADHNAEVIDVPAFDGFGQPMNCSYNGSGDWSWLENGTVTLSISIKMPTQSTTGKVSCAPESLSLFQLLGHSPPYRVWYYIGDPDEETGVMYSRRAP